ncbi:MAG: patatin-like protein, partial [Acidimicrobiales bacterium]
MPSEVDASGYEELRLGLVLNGGVSLAVWMGGVTFEIDRLRRGAGAYGEVLDLLETTARVDVIAGASAGGLNGGFLATAIAHDRPLEGLRELWISTGGFLRLFRSPFARHPPSLMDGDGYFRREIANALGTVAGPDRGRPAGVDPVHLTMVMSVLNGVTGSLADDFGGSIPDATHLGTFTFRRDATGRDDWARDGALARIALAARSSASFPFAFEPSFLPVGQAMAGRPDMADHVDFPSSRFAVDGGALMNKPFTPALAAIYAQPSAGQVRRALLYVAPDPGGAAADQPDDFAEPPGLATAILDSLMTMPRTESVARELREIRTHNDAVANLRLVRDSLSATDPTALAETLFKKLYLPLRATRSVDAILSRLDAAAGGDTRAVVRDRNRLRSGLLAARRTYLPTDFPAAGSDPAAQTWRWGISPVEMVADTVLDLLGRGLNLAAIDDSERRVRLGEAKGAVHRQREVLVALRELDDGFWECESAFATSSAWAESAFDRWAAAVDFLAERDPRVGRGVFEALAETASAMAAILVNTRADLLEVASAAGSAGGDLAASVK